MFVDSLKEVFFRIDTTDKSSKVNKDCCHPTPGPNFTAKIICFRFLNFSSRCVIPITSRGISTQKDLCTRVASCWGFVVSRLYLCFYLLWSKARRKILLREDCFLSWKKSLRTVNAKWKITNLITRLPLSKYLSDSDVIITRRKRMTSVCCKVQVYSWSIFSWLDLRHIFWIIR